MFDEPDHPRDPQDSENLDVNTNFDPACGRNHVQDGAHHDEEVELVPARHKVLAQTEAKPLQEHFADEDSIPHEVNIHQGVFVSATHVVVRHGHGQDRRYDDPHDEVVELLTLDEIENRLPELHDFGRLLLVHAFPQPCQINRALENERGRSCHDSLLCLDPLLLFFAQKKAFSVTLGLNLAELVNHNSYEEVDDKEAAKEHEEDKEE
mmetsp:Transcript_5182/g.10943  ORF Transcript_5182/g.10943 Transcript_5182/m.10943 type:complete len:208 (+) Transcript_5182:1448-2071(+)